MGLVKTKLKALPQTVVLDKWIPTTKLCPVCGTTNKYITLADRTYKCGCGYEFDRDIHSARNMITIAKSCFKDHLVPTEHRKITLTEFETSSLIANGDQTKLGRGNEKITPFKA